MRVIRAHITLLTTAAGGRHGSISSGYRPNLRIGDRYTDVALKLVGTERLVPGGEAEVEVVLVNPKYVQDLITVGAAFDITEGGRKVGAGTITSCPAQPHAT